MSGLEWCRAYSERVDAWASGLFDAATATTSAPRLALAAVGGYGRRELSPQSDLDLVLVHTGAADVTEVAAALWYPVWDEGLKLGHQVFTVRQALALAADDLDTATSLLSARPVAGDAALVAELAERAEGLWRKRSKRWLGELDQRVRARHDRAGEVAFLLEPDLKDGRGGLRDVHAIRWAERARAVLLDGDDEALADAYETLLSCRVELHRRAGRPGDRLVLEEQDAVAAALGHRDADELMGAVSAAARTIAWRSDELWHRVRSSLRGPASNLLSRERPLTGGVVLREGEVQLTADATPTADPLLVLRLAAAAAGAGRRIRRESLQRLSEAPELPTPWPARARELFAELLLAGRPALDVVEALDQVGLWTRLLPEWEPVRSRPQRNAYHTFTVDRHLCETAANAAALAASVDRADLLVVGALLHDIGKGSPGDHTEVGMGLVATMAERMGYPPEDVAVLVELVRHHLLLPDVATRRDLDDDDTIRFVATAVGSSSTLRLLAALTEADSLATGPAAWNSWKAGLVDELVRRSAHVLDGGAVEEMTDDAFPPEALLARLADRETVIEPDGDSLLVITRDRPGLFSRVAAVLALHGLDVLAADAHSTDGGMALEVFRVESPADAAIAWEPVVADLELALAGRLALTARLADRARRYHQTAMPGIAEPAVHFDNQMSASATVVEVVAHDDVGTLATITQALAEFGLDIRSAKVQTLGPQVVDTFYVLDATGSKVTDPAHLDEIRRALDHVTEA